LDASGTIMAISKKLSRQIEQSSWIRKMFEEAERLRRERGPDAILDLSLGNPIEEPPAALIENLRQLAADDRPGTHRYMPNAGFPETRKAIADLIAREQGISISAEHVIMSCGAAGGLNVVLKTLLDPGDEVLIFAPYFVEYLFYIDNHGGAGVVVESDDEFQPNPDRLAAAITTRTKAVIINSPNNPTGVVYRPETIRQMAAVLSEGAARIGHPIYLISDEVYRHLVYDPVELAAVFREYGDSLIVNSFSKDLGLAGERIGYVAVCPRAADAGQLITGCINTTRTLGFVSAPALLQRVVQRSLGSRVSLDVYRRNRDVLCEALAAAGLRVIKPAGAFYLFPACPQPDDVEYCAMLRDQHGLMVVPGSGFGRAGHVRIAYSVDHDTARRAAEKIRKLS